MWYSGQAYSDWIFCPDCIVQSLQESGTMNASLLQQTRPTEAWVHMLRSVMPVNLWIKHWMTRCQYFYQTHALNPKRDVHYLSNDFGLIDGLRLLIHVNNYVSCKMFCKFNNNIKTKIFDTMMSVHQVYSRYYYSVDQLTKGTKCLQYFAH